MSHRYDIVLELLNIGMHVIAFRESWISPSLNAMMSCIRVKQQWTRDSIGLQAQGWVSFRGYPLLDFFQSSCVQKEGFQVFYQGRGTCLAQAAYLVNGAIFST
jgi:hypothetical protein